MNAPEFKSLKKKKKIKMTTCYDSSFARVLNRSSLDAVLVGDSVAMVVYGQNSTVGATVDMIENHVKAVRSTYDGMIIADLPFMSVQKGKTAFVEDVQKLMAAGANALKVEGVDGIEDKITLLINSGVPVMGHVGLTPQFVNSFGGFKVQGKDTKTERKVSQDAQKLQALGCFAVVFECVPAPLAERLSGELNIPTIGIGAGQKTDGQILVLQDMLGLSGMKFKFVREYESFGEKTLKAIEDYCSDVDQENFPKEEHSFL
jgi:3-methyl-2-oxobutanoate hydroxymethyltransferase